MIGEPLNDQPCLGQLTMLASLGRERPELREVAARFNSTRDLAAWIRGLPQRDDRGEAADGPRVTCDVSQRARLVAADPNCVERSILYLAAAEVLDPRPLRQLATVDTPSGRHTFPVEDGEPVVLDPAVPRNALRAGLWQLRNAATTDSEDTGLPDVDPAALLEWVADLAEAEAEAREGRRAWLRARRGRRAFVRLVAGRRLKRRDRGAALYALRLAGEAAPMFGPMGHWGLRVARAAVARLCTARVTRTAPRNVNLGRAAYWTGKTAASWYGMGGLYDLAVAELSHGHRLQPPVVAVSVSPNPTAHAGLQAVSAVVPGSLDALAQRKGA